MAIYDNRKNRKRKVEKTEIPNAPAPKWVNPTAYVLARRAPDGTLTAVNLDDIGDMEKSAKCNLAGAVIGTQYALLRELLGKRENLMIQIQSDEMMAKTVTRSTAEPKEKSTRTRVVIPKKTRKPRKKK